MSVTAWAEQMLSQCLDRAVIVSMHSYLKGRDGESTGTMRLNADQMAVQGNRI